MRVLLVILVSSKLCLSFNEPWVFDTRTTGVFSAVPFETCSQMSISRMCGRHLQWFLWIRRHQNSPEFIEFFRWEMSTATMHRRICSDIHFVSFWKGNFEDQMIIQSYFKLSGQFRGPINQLWSKARLLKALARLLRWSWNLHLLILCFKLKN